MPWKLIPDDCALLIVDVQEKLFPLIDRREECLRNLKLLAGACRELGLPMVLTEQYPQGLGPTIPELSSVLKGVKAVAKTRFSAAEAFAAAGTGKRTVLVAGLETHICVRQTVYDLKARNVTPVLVADATGSRSAEARGLAIDELHADRFLITSAEATVYEFLGESTHPSFKAVTKMVKG